jgi:CRISPR system Cascade subunit CasE
VGDYPKQLRVQPVTNLTMKPAGQQRPKHFHAAMFEGLLACVDPERLHAAVLNGIGRGKGFGMGLLSLATVR